MTQRQLLRGKVFENADGERSRRYLDVLPQRLTLRRGYNLRKGETLFEEVRVVPFPQTMNERERKLARVRPRSTPRLTRAEFYDGYMAMLEHAIEDLWSPDKFHLVLHSSGYDSRAFSLALKRVLARRGRDWLGRILFACYGLEGPSFLEIMRWGGWREGECVTLPDFTPCYEIAVDFDTAWTWINVSCCAPGTLQENFIRLLHQRGRVPATEDVQLWYGFWGNPVQSLPSARNRFVTMAQAQYDAEISLSIFDADDVNDVFGHYDVIKYLVQAKVDLSGCAIHRELSSHFDCALGGIPRRNVWDDYPTVPPGTLARAASDYATSWYGRKVHPGKGRFVASRHRGWWGWWSRAALCDYLLRQGYEIEMEKK